jgi:hypothetical protein
MRKSFTGHLHNTVMSPYKIQTRLLALAIGLTGWVPHAAIAQSSIETGERLTATGGVTQIEGAAGGGLVPWALITGYGTKDEIGASFFATQVSTSGFRLKVSGVALGIRDRVELSAANERFSLGDTVPGTSITQEVVGIKLKLTGDAVFNADHPWPQISAGMQMKRNRNFDFVPRLLGARQGDGTDYYISATKLYLAALAGRNVLLNATVRATKANQFGILGFGGDRQNRYQYQAEASAAVLITDSFVVGGEYRQKPDNLSVFREDNAWDLFIAWFPRKEISITAGYVDLGNIANKTRQTGSYLSVQGSF